MAVHSRTKSLENNIKPLKNNSGDPELEIVIEEKYKVAWGQLMIVLIAIAAIVFFAIFLAKRNK